MAFLLGASSLLWGGGVDVDSGATENLLDLPKSFFSVGGEATETGLSLPTDLVAGALEDEVEEDVEEDPNLEDGADVVAAGVGVDLEDVEDVEDVEDGVELATDERPAWLLVEDLGFL